MRLLLAVVLVCVVSFVTTTRSEWAAQVRRREAVKASFRYNYDKYEEHAFGLDVLMPIARTGGYSTVLSGFGGSIVDSMSTMLVMGMADEPEYARALEHVRAIDFTRTQVGDPAGTVSVFELTIRYLGGLVSAFQLGGEREEHRFLIDKAVVLADELSLAWVGENKIPFNRININDNDGGGGGGPRYSADLNGEPSRAALIAEAGTLTMEWGALSRYTGNDTYRRLAEKAMDAIIDSEPVLPGLWAQEIWVDKAWAKGDYVSWGGGSDSFFEYLPKYPFLLGQDKHRYLEVYRKTVDSTIKHLFVKTSVGNLTFPKDFSVYSWNSHRGSIYVHSHLACFGGGNMAFGGRLLRRDDWVQAGLEWAESCAHTYRSTTTGIGPTGWGFFDVEGNAGGWDYVSPARRAFYNENGFFTSSVSWNHQPEVLESVFYAWRITGQEFWRDIAWEAFLNIRQHCDTGDGWSGIRNVNDPSTGVFDETQTFLFAELLKYLYLIFDDPESYSLDDYVFNTEAHPQRRAPGGDFGKVQGAFFPYRRITSNHTGRVPMAFRHRPPPKLETLVLQESASEPHGSGNGSGRPDSRWRWRFPSLSMVLGPGGCAGATGTGVGGDSSTTRNLLLASTTSSGSSWSAQIGHALYCRSYPLLLLPFAVIVAYRSALCIHSLLAVAEQELYLGA